MTTQVTWRMFSPSISTIASVSFSIIARFSSSLKTPSISLTFTSGMSTSVAMYLVVRPTKCTARLTGMSSAADPSTDGRAIRGQATRDRIVEAAREILIEQGHGGASTRAVADRAGVRLSLVHYHFGGRPGLLAEVLERENETL